MAMCDICHSKFVCGDYRKNEECSNGQPRKPFKTEEEWLKNLKREETKETMDITIMRIIANKSKSERTQAEQDAYDRFISEATPQEGKDFIHSLFNQARQTLEKLEDSIIGRLE